MSTVSVIYDLIGKDHASGAFHSASDSASRLEKTMGRVSKSVVVAGAAMATAAAAFTVESIKAAVSFQASMERIHTQAGASQKDVEALTRSVLKLAPSTQQGPEQLAEALYHLKSVGMDNADAMRALKNASDLAAVGGANLEDTTNALAGAWRSGIKGAQSFGQTASTVNAIIGAGNMKMEDFVAALGTGILPAAKTFGVSLSSVGSALALMTDEGVPAIDASTRLRMTLSLMGAPSSTAAKALATIGLSSTSLAYAMRSPGGLVAAVQLLSGHLHNSGLNAVQSAAVISKAFGGGRSSSAIMTLLNNLDVLERKQKQINDTTGKYGGAVAAQRQTAQAQFALLRSSIDTLGIRLGLDLLPPVSKFVGFLAQTALPAVEKFTAKVAGLIPVKPVEDAYRKVVTAIDDLLGIGGKKTKPRPVEIPVRAMLIPGAARNLLGPGGLPALRIPVTVHAAAMHPAAASHLVNAAGLPALQFGKTAAEGVTQSLGTVFATLGSALVNKIIAAQRKVNWGKVLADVINSAVTDAQEIGAAFLKLLGKVNWISMGSQFATVAIGLAMGLVNNLIPALIEEAIHHPLDMISFLLALIPIGKFAGALIKILKPVPFLGKLAAFFLEPIAALGDKMESALGKVLRKVFGPVGDRIAGYFANAKKWLVGKGEDVFLGLWYGAEHGWAKVTGWLGKIYGWVTGVFIKANVWLLLKGVDLIEGLLSGALRGWRVIAGWLEGSGGRITGYFAKAGSWLYSHGVALISGFKNGIIDAFRGIGSWVKSVIVDPIINWVKSWFGIHSPSTVMAWIGGHLMGGLFKGMMSGDLTGMVKKVFGSLPDALEEIVRKGLVSVTALPGKALSALGSFFGFGPKAAGGSAVGGMIGDTLNETIGAMMAAAMGWTGTQWDALQALWTRESGWSTSARNPSSGAYGIPQSLPADKMASAGPDWLTNPATQIKWGLGYIASVYGSPLAAWAHEMASGWYGHGGRFAAGQLIGVGERGAELAVFDRPGSILSPEQSAALLGAGGRGGDGVFTGNLYLDSGEFLGVVDGRIERGEKEIIRAARSGSGSRR